VTTTGLEPLLYTAEEASILLGKIYSPEVLRRKAGRGEIDCTRIGKSARWSRKNLDSIIAANECTAANYGRKKRR
jgi:hypothetical protein